MISDLNEWEKVEQRKLQVLYEESDLIAQQILADAKQEATEIREIAQNTRDQAEAYRDALIETAETEAREIIERTHNETKERSEQLLSIRETEVQAQLRQMFAELEDSTLQLENLRFELEETSKNHHNLNEEYNTLLNRHKELEILHRTAKDSYNDELNQIKNYLNEEEQRLATVRTSELELRQQIAHAKEVYEDQQIEFKNRMVLAEKEFVEMRASEMEQLRQMRAQEEIISKERRAQETQKISASIEHIIVRQIESLVISSDLENDLKQLSGDIRNTVTRVMNSEASQKEQELQDLLDFNPVRKRRQQRMITRIAQYGAPPLLMIILIRFFPAFTNQIQSFTISSKDDRVASTVFADKMRQKYIEETSFNPEQTEDFKETYTDNVLYTSQFLASETSEQYREKWIVAVNEFFVSELGKSEDKGVQFLTEESRLLTDLGNLSQHINKKFSEQAIQRLREREALTKKEFLSIVENQSNLNKLLRMKARFFNEHKISDSEASF
jgi:hypothetical protein